MPYTAPWRSTDTPTLDALGEVASDLLATYRLTTLVKDDKLTEDIRGAVFKRFGPPDGEDAHKASYLVNCPWCLSIYFGALAVAGRRLAPGVWGPLSKVLAFSAATGLLAESRQAALK